MKMAQRREAAELHADVVFREHLASIYGSTTLDKMANVLNEKGITPVRAGGQWTSMRVHRLVGIAQRAWANR